jgi:ribosomal protein L29
MPKKTIKTTKTTTKKADTQKVRPSKGTKTLLELKKELVNVRLKIKAGQEKNTNAHKPIKKQISQLLTKQTQE